MLDKQGVLRYLNATSTASGRVMHYRQPHNIIEPLIQKPAPIGGFFVIHRVCKVFLHAAQHTGINGEKSA